MSVLSFFEFFEFLIDAASIAFTNCIWLKIKTKRGVSKFNIDEKL
jgi:hypothetical protein